MSVSLKVELSVSESMPKLALLAGGLATRLGPISAGTAKSMVLVAGEPFIAHQMRLLVAQGITEIVLCCGYLSEQIQNYAGDGSRFGCRTEYSGDGAVPLGTGGAIRKALPLLGERFLVMYGDSYLPARIQPIWDVFIQSSSSALMTLFRNDGRWDTSNVEFDGRRILSYSKRAPSPAMQHIDYGLGCFRAEAFEPFTQQNKFDLAEIYERLTEDGQLAGHEVTERFYEIGSPSGLCEADAMLRRQAALEVAVQ